MTTAAEIAPRTESPSPAPHTLARFLELCPWPTEPLAHGAPLEFLWHFDLELSPAELWPYVMDTSRFNRAMGLSKMDFREVDGVMHGRTRNAGVLQEWVEVPWTWVARRTLTCAREYSRGFARHVRSIYLLEPLDGGRRVRFYVYFGWIPRSATARLFLRATFGTFEGGYRKVLDEIVRHARDARGTPDPYVRPAPALLPDAQTRLGALRDALRARLRERRIADTALDPLVKHITSADEMDLFRIQVLPLARAWRVDPGELLMVCLHATREGLLSLSWDVICPHCRGVRQEARTLGDVPSSGACAACDITFDTSATDSIEITFRPHPSVREVPQIFFCAAEPASRPHIELQQRVAPGQQLQVATLLPAGRYRVRLRGEKQYRVLEVAAEHGADDVPWAATDADPLPVARAHPTLVLTNRGPEAQTFVVERAGWADDALRPVQLFTLQEFRDLFTEEYLTADVQLSIGEQTVLFTDMIGSTRFYDTRGDPQAFAEVKRHFTEVYEIVRRHRGAVVKTIGDAVMAAFHQPVDALRAAVDIHTAFYAGRADTSIRLRVSMNQGPCIAVNLNSAIDYFGRTVNVASKLQACVEAGQISFPRAMREAPGVAEYLASVAAELEEVVVTSASLQQPVPAYRWDVNAMAARRYAVR